MKLKHVALIGLIGAALVAPVVAQPGTGMGGMGGMGMGPGGGRFAINKDNTTGWSLMTQEERASHREKMWSFKTYDECKAYQADHHKVMEAKAKEQGKALPAPRFNACDRMKARGAFK